ncbi:hypothetical protein HDU93_007900 [Gonapodya sp. JEL0774]|nr:hypothetical protein HDU93_007900 [Gonapodya sp. JEL0774]
MTDTTAASGPLDAHWFFKYAESLYGETSEGTVNYRGNPITVAVAHSPTQEDEVALFEGNRVDLTWIFRDGWGIGKNLATGAYGAFPIDCLALHEVAPFLSSSTNTIKRTRTESRAVPVASHVRSQRAALGSVSLVGGSSSLTSQSTAFDVKGAPITLPRVENDIVGGVFDVKGAPLTLPRSDDTPPSLATGESTVFDVKGAPPTLVTGPVSQDTYFSGNPGDASIATPLMGSRMGGWGGV